MHVRNKLVRKKAETVSSKVSLSLMSSHFVILINGFSNVLMSVVKFYSWLSFVLSLLLAMRLIA